MIDTIRAIIISEATPMKVELVDQLKKNITSITCVNTMVDGLSAIKDKQFDAAILSIDMEDFYTVSNMVRILLEVGSLRYILLVSEKEEPENETGKKQIHALHLLSSQEATNQILRDLKEMKFSLEADDSMGNNNDTIAGYAHEGSSLFDSVPLGLYRIDPEGNFLDINQTMVSILRAPNDAVLQQRTTFPCSRTSTSKRPGRRSSNRIRSSMASYLRSSAMMGRLSGSGTMHAPSSMQTSKLSTLTGH